MNKLVDANGVLNIENFLLENPSFQAIIEDRKVTQDEKKEQSKKILQVLQQLENVCTEEQLELIRKLLAEFCALIMASQMFSEE